MEINSVRALKAEILSEVLSPLMLEMTQASAFGLAASSARRAKAPMPGIALGVAAGSSATGFRLAVRIQRRMLQSNDALTEKIKSMAKQEVDIRYVGRVVKQVGAWHRSPQRPLLIGSSIGHHKITAGTIGAFVQRRKDRSVMILSNNHVLANEDKGKIGDSIIQPGSYDGGRHSKDSVARLENFVRFKPSGNLVDAAVALPVAGISVDPTLLTGQGRLVGLRQRPLEPGDEVIKLGRTTGFTRGRVTAIELDDVVVEFENGNLSFDNQIEVEGADDGPFSAGGDSGSLIIDRDKRAVGLLFAGGDTGGTNGRGLTFANDITNVLNALDLVLEV